jgi:hypothetical protein
MTMKLTTTLMMMPDDDADAADSHSRHPPQSFTSSGTD